jgi:oligoribonuclease NrnB/cAMP/cGMP phosphodiesterase (DHH superfamily)
MNKILLITHDADMDGMGAAILGNIVFDNMDVIYTNPDDLESILLELINSKKYLEYNEIFITDLGLRNNCYDIIENNLKDRLLHLDHHQTDKSYSWSTVIIDIDGFKPSATSIFYDYLLSRFKDNEVLKKDSTKELVEAIRSYDTYQFKQTGNMLGYKLTNVFVNIERNELLHSILERLYSDDKHFNLTNEEIKICDKCDKELEEYLDYCDKNLIRIKFLSYNVGLSISNKYRSSVGNLLSEKYKDELDFILIADYERESFSIRTVNDINVGNIAATLGGGGHDKAAGFPMNDDTLKLTSSHFDRNLLNKLKNEEKIN